MKAKTTYRLSFLFCFSLLVSICSSQTGTIKIAKPPAEKKDTLVPVKEVIPSIKAMGLTVSANYTFKDIKKAGFDVEYVFPFVQVFFVGLKYSKELMCYNLQPFNPETESPEITYSKSLTESDYIKMPFGCSTFLVGQNASITGGKREREICLSIGFAPEYLLKTSNQHDRLHYRDFRKFNLSSFASFGFPVGKSNFSVNLGYAVDLLNNLKDNNIYNTNGQVLGKRTSRTKLTTLSVTYRIRYASSR